VILLERHLGEADGDVADDGLGLAGAPLAMALRRLRRLKPGSGLALCCGVVRLPPMSRDSG
jgi:hypothetical protein